MRAVLGTLLLAACSSAGAHAGDSAATWEVRPFFARKAGQPVPPPQFYATTVEVPEGAVVTVKVVECPKKTTVTVHHFLGGPVFATGGKGYAGLAAGQTVTHKLDRKTKVGLTASTGAGPGTCKELKRKDGRDTITWACGDGDVVVEVEVTAP